MTREEAIRRYNETHTGGVQKSTPSISALSREEAIARYDAKQASKSWETRIGSIASREWQPPEYESYIPEEYKGKYEDFEEGWYGFDTVAAELKHNYGITPDKLENMTDEEKKLVTYLYTQDEPSFFEKIFAVKSDDKAYVRYAKELEEELERRGIERAAYEAQHNDGFWDKVGTSIGSVGNRVQGTFEGVDAIADALSGREVDETPFYTTLAEVKRQGVSEDMSGVGKFLYDVGMSWGDSMAMTGIGMLTGNPTAAKAISLIGMGSQAMSSTIADSKRRGMSDLQAIGNGILAGGIEAATEMIGIDALFDTRAFRNAFGKYLVKNIGANAGEEALAEVLGTVSDALVGQDKSRFMAKVREYQAKGYNESGAAAMAVLSVLGDTALAGLSGALMGLGSGTLGGAAQNVALNTRDVREGRAIRGLANAGKDLYGAARTMDNDKRIAATLKKLSEASS
ncbi:MAG: hypothetical protein IIV11_05030, partial [Clostridia bacterium]|nr:hypothetical protein [Clostridia bacterium]